MAQLQNPGGSYDWYFHQSQNSHYPPPFQSKTLSSAYNQSYNYHPQWPQPPYSSTAFQMRTLSSTYHPHQPPFNYPGFSSPQASYVSPPLPKPPDRISGQDGFDNRVIVEAHHQRTKITQDTSKSNVHHVEKLMDSSTWKVTDSPCDNMSVGEVVDSQVEKEKVVYQLLPKEDDKITHHVFEKMPESTHKGDGVEFGSTNDVEKLKMAKVNQNEDNGEEKVALVILEEPLHKLSQLEQMTQVLGFNAIEVFKADVNTSENEDRKGDNGSLLVSEKDVELSELPVGVLNDETHPLLQGPLSCTCEAVMAAIDPETMSQEKTDVDISCDNSKGVGKEICEPQEEQPLESLKTEVSIVNEQLLEKRVIVIEQPPKKEAIMSEKPLKTEVTVKEQPLETEAIVQELLVETEVIVKEQPTETGITEHESSGKTKRLMEKNERYKETRETLVKAGRKQLEVNQKLAPLVDKLNPRLISKLENMLIHMKKGHLCEMLCLQIQSQKGMIFVCALEEWGFGIAEFANFYDSKLGVSAIALHKSLLGPHYYTPKTKMIVGKKSLVAGSKTKPMLVRFVLESSWQVYEATVDFGGDKAVLEKVIKSFNLSIRPHELQNKEKDYVGTIENSDALKSWVIESFPGILKHAKLAREAKLRVQKQILKFLAVQGLFLTSLGTEVISFEWLEKFKWPKTAIPIALCKMCIEQLQLFLSNSQKIQNPLSKGTNLEQPGDPVWYFMKFLNTLQNIPTVSLFGLLDEANEKAFKELQEIVSKLLKEEINCASAEANKFHALRHLVVQLLLQLLLHLGQFSDAAIELSVCCNKAYTRNGNIVTDSMFQYVLRSLRNIDGFGQSNEVFKAMNESGYVPNSDKQSAIASRLCCKGKKDEANELVNFMESSGNHLDDKALASLVEGHCEASDPNEASACFKNMISKGVSYAGLPWFVFHIQRPPEIRENMILEDK